MVKRSKAEMVKQSEFATANFDRRSVSNRWPLVNPLTAGQTLDRWSNP
jgi:hypothetical protein